MPSIIPASASRRWAMALGLLALAGVLAVAWMGLGARAAMTELTAARDDMLAARAAIDASDTDAAFTALDSAAGHAATASDHLDGPLWDVAAAVPKLGATPAAAQAVAESLDQALQALVPVASDLASLEPGSMVGAGGRLDLSAVAEALPPLEDALDGVTEAQSTLALAPAAAGGDLVLGRVDEARLELGSQLDTLASTLRNVVAIGRIAPPMLGAAGTKRYFFAVLDPNEARGVGGFIGTYAILEAKAGRLRVTEVGSNSDLVSFPQLPIDLGDDFLVRYGNDPGLVGNMNLSPHYPNAARLWLASWEAKTGETLDGAIAADVVVLGDLVAATGSKLALPSGETMTGPQLSRFAIQGIYERYPTAGQAPLRDQLAESVTTSAFDLVTQASNPQSLATALGRGLSERRVLLWSADEDLEADILAAGVGGSLRVPDGHHVQFVALSTSGSKLDAFLERSLTYEVGRCADRTGRVVSRVTATLTNAIPKGYDVPEYMISQAERGPKGPINSTAAQFHLPNGAAVQGVTIDGELAPSYLTFSEQGRPAAVAELDLPPRRTRDVTVTFTEPAHAGPGASTEQPLAAPLPTDITSLGC